MVDNHKILKDITGQRIAAGVEAIAMALAGKSEDNSWKGVRNIVRSGMGEKAFPVGTQLVVEKETSMTASLGIHTGVTAVAVSEETFLAAEGIVGSGIHEFVFNGSAWIYNGQAVNLDDFGITPTGTPAADDEIIITEAYQNVIFDVVDHREVTDPVDGVTKPAMFLLMHNVIYSKPFDELEALYVSTEGLAAGAYKFTVKNHPWYAADNDSILYFTLTEALPANGQIVLSGATYNATLNGKSIKTYSGPSSTSAIETATISTTEIVGATDLGNTQADASWNHWNRAFFGSNNYKESAIRQWINSKAAASGWWAGSNKFDRPSSYASTAGLLHGMDKDFLDSVRAVTIPCKTNNTFELSGWTLNAAYTVEDRFFLASRNELGWGTENVAEGSVFKMYDGAANVDRIKYDISAQSTARVWWLRSPYPGDARYVRSVGSDGSLSGNSANYGNGAVAACAIM